MRGRYRPHPVSVIARVFICLMALCVGDACADEKSKYLDAVRTFANNVLKYGKDTYGPKHTPLFVDGLNIHTHEPVKWIAPNGDRWILSNLASQQNLFRTLDGLTKITGDPKYKQAAMEAIEYAFENLRSPNGLLYWGIASAYDAQADSIYAAAGTSLKIHYPYYELMWRVDSEKTKEFIESFWSAHILDWRNLDMDRIGGFNEDLETPWSHEYIGGPVFFRSKHAASHSFFNTGSDLFYAGGVLSRLSGAREPLIWSKRLAHRYVETRKTGVGISGNLYNKPIYWAFGRTFNYAQRQFSDDFKGHLVLEGTLFPSHPEIGNEAGRQRIIGYLMSAPGIPYSVVTNYSICQLLLGEFLGSDGEEFTKWAFEELVARGKKAYRREDNSWIPMFTDGTSLEGYVCSKGGDYGFKGMVFKPIPAVPMDFWAYSLVFRLTGDRFMLEMADNIVSGIGLGSMDRNSKDKVELQEHTSSSDPYALLAFLELYKKTQNKAFLNRAGKIGDNILGGRFYSGFFIPSNKHIYVKFDSIEPLVLLHLDATIRGEDLQVPRVWPSRPLFHTRYRGKGSITDYEAIYSLMASLEPPVTLQEAATIGDIQQVKLFIAEGINISARDVKGRVALHCAVENGHDDVTKLLIANGVDVNVENNRSETPLHRVAEKGYMEIAKLLICAGANVTAKNTDGQTPLHYAVWNHNKDITELLIADGVDVDVTNNFGSTPLHFATERGKKDIAELLLANGADINAKNNDGQTPIDVAVSRNRKEIVELLIAKGADVNARDRDGRTPLSYAQEEGYIEIAELLRKHGAKE